MSRRTNQKRRSRRLQFPIAVLTVLLVLVCAGLVYLRMFVVPAPAAEQRTAPVATASPAPLVQAAETAASAEDPAPTAEPEATPAPTAVPEATPAPTAVPEATAVPTPEPTPEPAVQTVQLTAAEPGDTVSFGSLTGETIYWVVLSAEDGKLTLLSLKVLSCLPYCDTFRDSSWEGCDLRRHLNEDFLTETFSEAERGALSTIQSYTSANTRLYIFQSYTSDSAPTEDLVVLFSTEEAERYAAAGIPLAAAMSGTAAEESNEEYSGCWWLRSPGRNMSHAAYVNAAGTIISSGVYTSCPYLGIRPVICVDTELLPG